MEPIDYSCAADPPLSAALAGWTNRPHERPSFLLTSLFSQELLKYTSRNDQLEWENLKEAIEIIKAITRDMDNLPSEELSRKKIQEIQDSISGDFLVCCSCSHTP